MSFFWRFIALLIFLSIAAWVDWRWKRERATRWREYSFLLAAGLFAGLLGVAIDQVTATVSPDYFAIGKGIPKGDHFRLGVAVFGFEAGFTMGIVVGGIYLLANNPKRDRLALSGRQLFGFLLIPIVAALALMPVGLLCGKNFDPLDLRHELKELLTSEQLSRFLDVWRMHLGLYAGGALGTICGVIAIRRKRPRLAAANFVEPDVSSPPEPVASPA